MKNKSITYWLRILHRDIGFIMVGICLIYAISGILLNHMDGKDPSYKTEEYTLHLEPNLDRNSLKSLWNNNNQLPQSNRVIKVDDTHLQILFDGGLGIYNTETGQIDYEKYTKRPFVYWITKLHYNKVRGWNIMADVFAISMVFFALSGLFMVKGKKGITGNGKWYLLIGIMIPILYVIFA